MVPGEVGGLGPSVPRLVVEELKLGGESVMIEIMVVETARVTTLNRDSATLTPVQVKKVFCLTPERHSSSHERCLYGIKKLVCYGWIF